MQRNYNSGPELTIYIDLAHLPITFDCLGYLWGADLYRQKLGIPRQRICILSDKFRSESPRDLAYGDHIKTWRRLNFIDRMSWLFPATSTVSVSCEFPHELSTLSYPENYNFSNVKRDWAKLYATKYSGGDQVGLNPFPLKAPLHAKELVNSRYPSKRIVTLSVRDSEFQPERNWPLDSVKDVCLHLKSVGLDPVIIPDFEVISNASSELYCWDSSRYGDIFWQGSADLFLRMALYEHAIHNLLVGNGTSYLCWFSEVAYSLFNIVVPGYHTTSEEFQYTFHGTRLNQKPKWSVLANQHWVWERCEAENIIRHLKNISI